MNEYRDGYLDGLHKGDDEICVLNDQISSLQSQLVSAGLVEKKLRRRIEEAFKKTCEIGQDGEPLFKSELADNQQDIRELLFKELPDKTSAFTRAEALERVAEAIKALKQVEMRPRFTVEESEIKVNDLRIAHAELNDALVELERA